MKRPRVFVVGITVLPGTFTPDGSVLCTGCAWLATVPCVPLTALEPGQDVARCERCCARVAVREDVALCQGVVRRLNRDRKRPIAALRRLGQDCACRVTASTDYEMLITADDGCWCAEARGNIPAHEDGVMLTDMPYHCASNAEAVATAIEGFVAAHPTWASVVKTRASKR